MKKNKNNLKEPFVRIVKRDNISFPKIILIYSVAIVGSLLLSGLISVLFSEKGVGDFFQSLFTGAFGSERKFWLLLQDTSLLLGTSMALLPAFKMKFWNLGGNGQILVGCLAAIACMFYLGGEVSDSVIIPLMLISSVAAGAVWAVIPAIFKAKFNTNESLFTLMMNYIATQIIAYYVYIEGGGSNVINPVSYGNFPAVGNNDYFVNIVTVAAITVLMYVYLRYSKQGYEISVVGESQNTARYVGINVRKTIIRTMLLSGAICGIAGFITVAGKNMTLSINTAGGYGFTAIIVAWLAKFNTGFMALISFLLIFLEKGATQIASAYSSLNDYASSIVTGVILFFILGSEFFINYRLIFRKGSSKGGESK